MAPHFSDTVVSILKEAMLQHEADGWRFTPEDVIALVARTQLTEKQVKDWESSTRRRSAETIKKWLESKTEKVSISLL